MLVSTALVLLLTPDLAAEGDFSEEGGEDRKAVTLVEVSSTAQACPSRFVENSQLCSGVGSAQNRISKELARPGPQ